MSELDQAHQVTVQQDAFAVEVRGQPHPVVVVQERVHVLTVFVPGPAGPVDPGTPLDGGTFN
jgi:hypothetical protein